MLNFKTCDKPILTVMLKKNTVDDLILEIKNALKNGAEAFGFQIETLDPTLRTKEVFTKIISAMEGRPAYITNYRRNNVSKCKQTDEELAKEMLLAMECGAKLMDIRGDMFDPNDSEITYNPVAVKKQKDLIDKIHSMGGEVLMSTHALKYLEPDEVMNIAKAQASRGVDIVKIVVNSNNREELNANFNNIFNLNTNIEQPVLFLTNGDYCRLHRIYGPILAKPTLFLVVDNDGDDITQPTIDDAKIAIELTKRHFVR